MTNERFIELFDKSSMGILSESEAIEWNEWIGSSEHIREMVELLQDEEYLKRTVSLLTKARQEDWQEIMITHSDLKPHHARIIYLNRNVRIHAAVFIILIGFAAYWFLNLKGKEQKMAAINKSQIQDIAPSGIIKARITLANGQVVTLDSLTSEALAFQRNANVVKNSNGQVYYKGTSCNGSGEFVYTLINPRGSKILSINLIDGTKIWLNSESALRYPIVFKGNKRRVELSGEAYFEVANSSLGKNEPFIVVNGAMTIAVLGAKFNVNTYNNEEDRRVTLLEGEAILQCEQGECLVKSGQQAVVSKTGISLASAVDLEQVMAWK